VQRLHRLPDRRLVVEPVALQHVDVVDAEALERALDRGKDALRSSACAHPLVGILALRSIYSPDHEFMTGTSGRSWRPVEVEICPATSTRSLERPLVCSKLSLSTCLAVDRSTLEHVFNSSD
jgi:hypothetical protein